MSKRYPGVYRRGSTWSWRAQFSSAGDRKGISGSGYPTAKDASQARAAALQKAVNRRPGNQQQSDVTLGEWLESWLEGHVATVRQTSASNYRARVAKVNETPQSKARLRDLTETDYMHLVAELRKQSPGHRTLTGKIATVSQALNAAIRAGLISENPLSGLRVARTGEKFKPSPWNRDQAQAFLRHRRLNGDPRHHVWHLALATGLRRGECHGLQWSDVDFTGQRLWVRRQRVDVHGTIYESAPKTSTSEAPVYLDGGTCDLLRSVTRTSEYVLTDHRTGQPYRAMSTFDADFRKACDEAQVPRIRFHDLRHTAASLMAAAGVPLPLAQARMRHWSPAMTEHYTHADTSMGSQVAEQMGSFLNPDDHGHDGQD